MPTSGMVSGYTYPNTHHRTQMATAYAATPDRGTFVVLSGPVRAIKSVPLADLAAAVDAATDGATVLAWATRPDRFHLAIAADGASPQPATPAITAGLSLADGLRQAQPADPTPETCAEVWVDGSRLPAAGSKAIKRAALFAAGLPARRWTVTYTAKGVAVCGEFVDAHGQLATPQVAYASWGPRPRRLSYGTKARLGLAVFAAAARVAEARLAAASRHPAWI